MWSNWRDKLLFFGGLAGVATLTLAWLIAERTPEPSLLVMFGAMMGLTAFLRADERNK